MVVSSVMTATRLSGSLCLSNGCPVSVPCTFSTTDIFDIGYTLAVTDTNGDGYGEVIAGDPLGEVGMDLPGLVVSLPGRGSGLSASGAKVFSQDTVGVPGANELRDQFGAIIAVGDVTGDGLGDVLVGVPGEDIGSTVDAGSVVLLRGAAGGQSLTPADKTISAYGGALVGPQGS
jgi:FG-GAP repeat